MASEHSAADAIRASVQALREDERQPWWTDVTGDVYSGTGSGEDRCVAEVGTNAAARHIAKLASPDVALALAAHLDAVRAWEHADPSRAFRAAGHVIVTRDALEAVILGSGQ